MMTKRGMAGWATVAALLGMFMVGCGDDDATACVDAGPGVDLGPQDAGTPDDASADDLGTLDDAGAADLGVSDDAGSDDLGPPDLGPPDMGGRCAAPVSGDPRWAQYPIPGTPGQPRTYQVTGAPGSETVIDCVTGLEWQRDAAAGTYGPADATAYCEGLTLEGYTDWRLPSRIELVTLVDYSVAFPGPTIDTAAFPGTPAEVFWSSSSVAVLPSLRWTLQFNDGYTGGGGVSLNARARCVRGTDTVSTAMGAPPGHFTNVGDGTVRDNLTGLVWQQGVSPSTQDQAASGAYCSTLTMPSGGGWRLPTVAELQTLVDETVLSPAIDLAYFPSRILGSIVVEEFWSSSSYPGLPSSQGWGVHFGSGDAVVHYDGQYYRARCVR